MRSGTTTLYFNQTIDHFSPNKTTFSQRFYINTQFWGKLRCCSAVLRDVLTLLACQKGQVDQCSSPCVEKPLAPDRMVGTSVSLP